jgi:hypothetical protein
MSSNPVKFNLKKPSPAATTAPGDGPITLKRKAETEAPQGDTPGGVEPIQAKKPRESEGVKVRKMTFSTSRRRGHDFVSLS